MTEYETIIYKKNDGFVTITLNRPKSLNALNLRMWEEINRALNDINDDDEIKAFIFTGASRPDGRPCFCAGADLKEMSGFTSDGILQPPDNTGVANVRRVRSSWAGTHWELLRPKPAMAPTFERIMWSPKISIAAVDGVCTAGGIELALACDLTVVSETAEISDMHAKNLGWIGGAAATANMAWRVGVMKAIELCCTGDVIKGKEAYRIGFANQVWPPDQYLYKAEELAMKIASVRLAALTMIKATCRSVEDMDRKSTWRYCDDAFVLLLAEQDAASFGPDRWAKGQSKS